MYIVITIDGTNLFPRGMCLSVLKFAFRDGGEKAWKQTRYYSKKDN